MRGQARRRRVNALMTHIHLLCESCDDAHVSKIHPLHRTTASTPRNERVLSVWLQRKAEPGRLETNTSMPHMIGATSSGPGEPRVRIPVKRFLACPFTFTDSPDHAGVSCTIRDMGLRRRSPRSYRLAHRKLVH